LLATAFPGVTHTRLTISSLSFQECKSDETGLVVEIVTVPPYFLHVTGAPVANSSTGTFELPAGSPISLTFNPGAPVCVITIRPQSIRLTVTDNLTTIAISDRTIAFGLDRGDPRVCPDPATTATRGELTSGTIIVYAVDTRRTRITAASPVGG
jgi:hypothetical protein